MPHAESTDARREANFAFVVLVAKLGAAAAAELEDEVEVETVRLAA